MLIRVTPKPTKYGDMRITEITAPSIPGEFFHATPQWRYEKIMTQGLLPSAESHPGKPPGVYLSRDMSGAVNYAEMNFGEEQPQPWVILRIDGKPLNPSKLAADCGHETPMAMDETCSSFN